MWRGCHKPYFVGFEVWPWLWWPCWPPPAVWQLSQTLFCWIWGLTISGIARGKGLTAVTNLILLDLRSDLPSCRSWPKTSGCHKPYFVGFEVWPSQFFLLRYKGNCHKPYFVGFEVWPDLAEAQQNSKYLVSQTLFCWIWGLTDQFEGRAELFGWMSQTLFCWIWGLTK